MSITIDGTTYDVPIVELDETINFLDKFAERTEDGVLRRELIGTYHNQKIVFGDISDKTEYALLWAKLGEAVEFHNVTVPDEDGVDFSFSAYFSNVTRKIRRWTDTNTTWRAITVNFTAQAPRNTP